MHPETLAIRTQIERTAYAEHSAPLFLTSSFVFETAEEMRDAFNEESNHYIYSRYGNPNTDELIQKICALEGAEDGITTSSGMAAIYSSFMALLKSGDHIISCSSIFGATHTIITKYFPAINISHSYFSATNPQEIIALIKPETKLIFLETPTNPAIEIIDLEYVGRIARENNILLIVDNCFATPCLQQPIKFGADIVIHSATKYIDGQGRVLGGIVVGKKNLIRQIYLFNRITGASLSPFNAWILSKSLETLSLRMEKHCQNALFLATELQHHCAVEKVSYPALPQHPHYGIAAKQMKAGGGIFTINLNGGYEACKTFLNHLRMVRISPNLGDSRTIATHPASSTHCKLSVEERENVGITDGLIRISAGLENNYDILNDILQSLSVLE